jgi:hypothetical protein
MLSMFIPMNLITNPDILSRFLLSAVFEALAVPGIVILRRRLAQIRHFGILGSSAKAWTIPMIHRELGILLEREPRILEIYNPRYCVCWDKETMISTQRIYKRGPPKSNYLPKILTF